MSDDLLDEYGVKRHEHADEFNFGTWTEPGHCMCGETIPAQRDWKDAGRDWASWTCPGCGRCFVDEEEIVMIYDDGCDADEGAEDE